MATAVAVARTLPQDGDAALPVTDVTVPITTPVHDALASQDVLSTSIDALPVGHAHPTGFGRMPMTSVISAPADDASSPVTVSAAPGVDQLATGQAGPVPEQPSGVVSLSHQERSAGRSSREIVSQPDKSAGPTVTGLPVAASAASAHGPSAADMSPLAGLVSARLRPASSQVVSDLPLIGVATPPSASTSLPAGPTLPSVGSASPTDSTVAPAASVGRLPPTTMSAQTCVGGALPEVCLPPATAAEAGVHVASPPTKDITVPPASDDLSAGAARAAVTVTTPQAGAVMLPTGHPVTPAVAASPALHTIPALTAGDLPSASLPTSGALPSSGIAAPLTSETLPASGGVAPAPGGLLPVGLTVSPRRVHPLPVGVDTLPVGRGSSSVLPGVPTVVEMAAAPPTGISRDVPVIDEDVDLSEVLPEPHIFREERGSRAPPADAQLSTEEFDVGSSLTRSARSPPAAVLNDEAVAQDGLRASDDQDGGVPDVDPGDLSDATVPEDGVTGENPRDGVYELGQETQDKISTLLRTLFSVTSTSDKSIMAFLGIAHYLMAYSHLVGICSRGARSKFSDSLLRAFEKPVSMKFFMEQAFECGRQGLHVGGRIRATRHVAGQPTGHREDILRGHINDRNTASQWLCRRLVLRTHVDIQRGARSLAGGLTRADRDTIAASVAADAVCTMLQERGCLVKFAKNTGDVKKPLSVTFQWDVKTTWHAEGMAADLVSELRGILLTKTPHEHVDRLHVPKRRKPPVRPGAVKRRDSDGARMPVERATKRPKVGQETQVSNAADEGGVSDEGADSEDRVKRIQVITSVLDHWSADVAPSAELPHGGHVLALGLPMQMDTGPRGRPYVDFFFSKVINAGAAGPPYKYVLTFECSKREPEQMSAVEGASFSTQAGQPQATSGHSFDMLQSVRTYVSRRQPPRQLPGRGPRGQEDGQRAAAGGLRLRVRSVSRPVALLERIDIESDYELSSRPELVSRSPGRMIIFLEGMDPVPVTGAFTL